MERKYIDKFIIIILAIFMSLSFGIFSFQQIPQDFFSAHSVIITCLTAFFCAFYFFMKTKDDIFKKIENNPYLFVISYFLAYIILKKNYDTRGVWLKGLEDFLIPPQMFSLIIFILAVPAFGYFLVWIIDRMSEAIKDIFSEADSSEKKLYLFLTIGISLIVMLLYFNENMFFSSTDKTFATDQGKNYNYVFSNLNNYDIRHPLFETLYFPIYSVVEYVVNIFVPQNLKYEIANFIIQEANIQFSLLSAFILKKLTGSKTIFWLYCLSFSFVFHLVITEKYNLGILLVLMYIFYMFQKPHKSTEKLIGATGIMPTSALIGVLELTMVKNRKIKDMVIRVFEMVMKTVLTIICFGRICFFDPLDFHMLPSGSTYVVGYLTTNTTLTQKLISFTKLVRNAFFCLDSNAAPGASYVWQSILENVEFLSIFIVIIMLIGFTYKHKEAFTKICGLWALFSFVFVVIIGWSPVDSPIFSFYFLWAYIPLIKYGIDCLAKLFRFKSSYVFAFVIIMMTIIDVAVITDINNFLQTF